MHTEYYLLTVDVTVQGPVTLTAATQGRRKERLGPKQNPSQIETGFFVDIDYFYFRHRKAFLRRDRLSIFRLLILLSFTLNSKVTSWHKPLSTTTFKYSAVILNRFP